MDVPGKPPMVSTSVAHLNQTPGKCLPGQLYNSQQYQTPTHRMHVALPNSTPTYRYKTPKSKSYTLASGLQVTPKLQTPQDPASNPFDGHLLEELGAPFFSPNVFMNNATPPGQKAFKWDIDQIAVLKPVEIEEMPLQQDTLAMKSDRDMEARAQRAIDAFFSQQIVAPSPWTDSGKKKPFYLPMTPQTPAGMGSPLVFQGNDRGQQRNMNVAPTKQDVSCQTMLTLPSDFDLQKVLGDYYTHQAMDDETGPDALSTSSLRRKLFFHGDNGTPISPVKSCSQGVDRMEQGSPHVSPVRCVQTPQQSHHRNTSSSTQFSSSPIQRFNALPAHMRRCSTAPGELLGSPLLSPIGSSASSSGYKPASTPGNIIGFTTPHSLPMQATPSTGSPKELFGSPGMSPIVNADGSYVSSPSGQHSGYSNGSSRSRSCGRLAKIPAPVELHPCHSPVIMDPSDEVSYISKGAKRDLSMELEMEGEHLHNSHLDNLTSAFEQIPIDSSHKDPRMAATELFGDCIDDCKSQTGITQSHLFASEDTGYHTNSMQSTNHDTQLSNHDAGLHTNLTSQLSCLPLSSHSLVTDGAESCSHSSISPTSELPFTNLRLDSFNQYKDDAQHMYYNKMTLTEASSTATTFATKSVFNDDIVERARKALYKANNCPEDSFLQENPHPAVDSLRFKWQQDNMVISTINKGGASHLDQGVGDQHVLPSELAQEALRRAEDDYALFCTKASTTSAPILVTNTVTKSYASSCH